MPFLSDEDRERYRKETETECFYCHQKIHSEYCAQCDEFAMIGHALNCFLIRYAMRHEGHRHWKTNE